MLACIPASMSRRSNFRATSEMTSDCANTTQVELMSHGAVLSSDSGPTWSMVVSRMPAMTSMNLPVPAAHLSFIEKFFTWYWSSR